MGNDELIKIFLKKHNYDGNIVIQTKYGNTWDDVVSIICNENDIPSKKVIPIEDIEYDLLSELPEDLFYQWLEYCNTNGDISYKKWVSSNISCYTPLNIDNSSSLKFREEVEQSIDKVFSIFDDKYSKSFYDDSDEDEDFEDDEFEDIE